MLDTPFSPIVQPVIDRVKDAGLRDAWHDAFRREANALVTVSDTFEALAADRPARARMSACRARSVADRPWKAESGTTVAGFPAPGIVFIASPLPCRFDMPFRHTAFQF